MHLLKMIQNEKMKMYRRPGTWIMIGITVLIVMVLATATKYVIEPTVASDWQSQLQQQNEQLEMTLVDDSLPAAQRQYAERDIAKHEHRITNEIMPIAGDSLWGFVIASVLVTSIITLFTVIIAGGIVANEFSWGTIKLLLIRPVSRSKVLLSKFLATIIFAVTMFVILGVTSFLIGALFFGFGGVDQPFIAYANAQVVEQSMLLHVISLFGFSGIDLLMLTTIAFMISTIFRSSSLAIGLSIFLMFTGPQLTQLFSRYDWVKYILFANTDLKQYFGGMALIEGMTLSFSITLLVIHFVLFIAVTWFVFNKRDVAV